MLNLQLIDLVRRQYPNSTFAKKEDLIRVEKILKAEAKLDSKLKVNDIEYLLAFLNTHGEKFFFLLQNKSINAVLKGEKTMLEQAYLPTNNYDNEFLQLFRAEFSANISAYLTQCIKRSDWQNLSTIFNYYSFLINEKLGSETLDALSAKNLSITAAIHQKQLISFLQKQLENCR